ncbi:sugar phosphate isomerase/epimerase [Candidatus Pacearchaeota archaeon]|nr:sugar phosphate isomerase/epimerase [Candidatus Pacearchaeota archaeon]
MDYNYLKTKAARVNMKPLICYSIGNLKEFSFEEYPFEGYELKTSSEGFKPNILILLKLKEMFKGKDLSLHSQLSRIFSCNEKGYPEFNEAELKILRAEIIMSNIIGIKQIIFHMKEGFLTKEEKEKFREIINFAKDKGIVGHLNTAIQSGKFGMELMEFIDRIKPRIVHIHAHNNYGDRDSHNPVGKGNFPWKDILDKLKDQNLKKIIIENRTKEEVVQSKKLLEKYYK